MVNEDSTQPSPHMAATMPSERPKLTWKPPPKKRKRLAKKTVKTPIKGSTTVNKGTEGAGNNETEVAAKHKNQESENKARECARIGRKKRSWVWDHFTMVDENSPEPHATCNYCDQSYAAHSKQHGTGNLIHHLNVLCNKYPYRAPDEKQKTLVFYFNQENSALTLKTMTYSYEECRVKLVEMIIIDELPFKIVEGQGFQRFVVSLQPKFVLPCRVTVATDCMKLFEQEKKKLKKLIKSQRICLTTDTWSSIQNINYMCLTAHWIDENWDLQKRILSFCVIPNHKGKTIGKMVEKCLYEWGIDKLLTITVDNASSNNGAINYLKKNTKGWKSTILDNEFMHLRCCAHILNLIVKDGLKNQNQSILKIRNAVRYVRSSPARLSTFKTCAEIEKIESKSLVCLDIETRWNSTFLMLDAATKFEKAFDRLREDDGNYRIYFSSEKDDDDDEEVDESFDDEIEKCERAKRKIGPPFESDWVVAKSFVKFLKLFYDVTLKFSGSLHVTSNMFFQELVAVQGRLLQLSKNTDPYVCQMASGMQKKFAKYWESVDKLNFMLYVATVMDPRFKLKFIKFCLDGIYGSGNTLASLMEEQVQSVLVRLYDWYCKNSPRKESSSSNLSQVPNVIVDMDDDIEAGSFLVSQFEKHMEEDDYNNCKSELILYLEEKCERNVPTFDVLKWWKDHAKRFPIVSQIARDVLAIPVSTVASESAFSTSGRILDQYRSSLNPEMVEALVCCQNWLKSTPSTIDIQESMKAVSIQDVEKYAEIIREVRSTGGGPNSKSIVIDE